MKKLLVLASCFVAVLILSKMSFAQEDSAAEEAVPEAVAVVAQAPIGPHTLPFGYPPYPSVGAYPAYGVPYSYPRAPVRRPGGRFAPPAPAQYQPYPLPAPGAVPPAYPPVANPVPPTFRNRVLPPRQGILGAAPPAPVALPGQPGQPNVFYRPTPVKNFMTMVTAPRPYIGYDPYAGLQPAPPFEPVVEPQ